jgi:lipopolysaccharide export system protein LptA
MTPHPITPLLALLLAGFCCTAQAEKADRSKPMNIEADTGVADDLKQTTVFNGNVVLSKGTLLIRGAQLTYREDAQGYQYGTVIAEPGKLAFFRQKRDGVDEFIEGEAETIIYDGRADTVKFVTKAIMRRLKGAQLNDEMTGAVILLDNVKDSFNIDGTTVKNGVPQPGGRVRVMMTPKGEAASGQAPGSPATPAAPTLPAASGVRLRPSPSLSGDKQ